MQLNRKDNTYVCMNYTSHSFSRRAQKPVDGEALPGKRLAAAPGTQGHSCSVGRTISALDAASTVTPRSHVRPFILSTSVCAPRGRPRARGSLTWRVRGEAADLWAVPGPRSDSAGGTWRHPGPHLTFYPESGSRGGGDGRGTDAGLQASLPSTHNAARSVARSPGADAAPAPSAAPQPGLSRWRLSALRQLRKEALRPTGRRPPPRALTSDRAGRPSRRPCLVRATPPSRPTGLSLTPSCRLCADEREGLTLEAVLKKLAEV